MTNVDSMLGSASAEIMKLYAELVLDSGLREETVETILTEFELAHLEVTELFGSEMSRRRPRLARSIQRREAPLRLLHQHQVMLLKEWRETKLESAREQLQRRLLLSVNAIASGLRTTG